MSLINAKNSDPGNDPPELVRAFLAWLDSERGYSPATLRAYATDLREFEGFLQTLELSLSRHGDVERDHVRGLLARLHLRGVKKSTVSRKLSSIRAFFRYLDMRGLLDNDPTSGMGNPKQERRTPRALNVDQTKSVMEAPTPPDASGLRDHALVELLYGAGLRVSEALALDVDEVDPGAGVIRVHGKGSKQRLVPIGATSAKRLRAWIRHRHELLVDPMEPALFLGDRGGRLHRRQAHRIVARLARDAGLPESVHPHTLRGSFASHLLQGGADLRDVQELLGHERISTTQRYTSLDLRHVMGVYDRAHPLSGDGSLQQREPTSGNDPSWPGHDELDQESTDSEGE